VRLVDDIYKDDDSKAWADYTIKLLGQAPDIVFTSEAYGDPWARLMGSEHMLVDLERKHVPVSATEVRKNPLATWRFLGPDVRSYYAVRVALVGADSTGKTTLTQALAKHYRTTWAPEYGRMYTLGKVTSAESEKWDEDELLFIAEEQNRLEDRLAGYSNKIFFCDTDALTTALWNEHLLGSWSKEIEDLFINREYAAYLLADVDIPYKQDNIRHGKEARLKMHKRFVELLEKYQKPYYVVSGTEKQRLAEAVKICDKLI
jgi:HTH-type transcriptional repressor of NAD biosynthesis genes